MPPRELPIWQLHFDVLRILRHGSQLVLVAATGSGKTTQVPQMLLDGGLAGDRRIVVLQPRRVAARTVAHRVAWERGVKLGTEVGYQVRFEDHLATDTRICFVTEGILLRWLQDDPELRRIGILIFDEFHERNLLSDVALALAKRLQLTTRPDLKLLVMSATLEAEPVAQYLATPLESPARNPAPILISEGRTFPVSLRWSEYGDRRPAAEQAADAVERIVNSGAEGDILVFMPGMGEITSTINALRGARLNERCVFIPLHGELPPDDQDRAFQPFSQRKIVVATNVAETSVTIDGIRHVVDSGEARIARYDAERGLQTLSVEAISRASADQRTGRAGRTSPGTCWRLWTESAQLDRPAKNTPEIQRADLAEVVLLLHSLGIRRAAEFDWLDRPDLAAVERAEQLLVILGALRAKPVAVEPGSVMGVETPAETTRYPISDLTPVGRQMLRLPMHPRYSRMLVEASQRNCVPAAALCAALTSGRDLLMRLGRDDGPMKESRELFEASRDSDFYTLTRAFQFAKNCNFDLNQCRRHGIHAQTARQVEDTCHQLLAIVGREGLFSAGKSSEESGKGNPAPSPGAPQDALEPNAPGARAAGSASLRPEEIYAGGPGGPRSFKEMSHPVPLSDPLPICLAAGFIDQLAVRQDAGTLECRLTGGRTGTLVRESVVDAPLLVAGSLREVDGRHGRTTLLALATAVRPEWLRELYPQHLSEGLVCAVDRLHKRVATRRETSFLDLVFHRENAKEMDPAAAGRALAEAFAAGWFELPQLDHPLRQFVARVNLLARIVPELEVPPFDSAAMSRALTRAFYGLTLIKEAQAIDLRPALTGHLEAAQLGFLDELLPISLRWLDGRNLKLLYPETAEEKTETIGPEVQVKLTDCFSLKEHPRLAEGRVPITLALQAPDQKRLGATTDFPAWRLKTYPTQRAALRARYPSFPWP